MPGQTSFLLSGKETLNDTVGICYKNAEHEDEVNDQQQPDDDVQAPNPTRSSMKSFKMQPTELEPYRKKARMTIFTYSMDPSSRMQTLLTSS